MSGAPGLSVVIPTRDRAASLARCLYALGAQEVDVPVEVVVVDDGSRDGTRELLAERLGGGDGGQRRDGELVVLHRPARGRSAARNAALQRARGRLVLFVDDDVLAPPGLLQRHVDHHRAHPADHEALVGPVTWAPELEVTPHMRWLENGGPLFAFAAIEDPENVGWRHFCTANASVKRAFLGDVPVFDEDLPRFVDAELGYRLHRRGMRLRYDAGALAHHLRVDTPRTTVARMRTVGRALRIAHAKHPELAEPPPAFTLAGRAKAALLRPLAPALDRGAFPGLAAWLYGYDAARAFARGYAEQDARLRAG